MVDDSDRSDDGIPLIVLGSLFLHFLFLKHDGKLNDIMTDIHRASVE